MGFNFLEVTMWLVHLEHWVSANKLASVVSLLSWEAEERGLFSFSLPRNVHLHTGRSRAGLERHDLLRFEQSLEEESGRVAIRDNSVYLLHL